MNEHWKKTKQELEKVEASSAGANDKWGRIGGVRKTAELPAPGAHLEWKEGGYLLACAARPARRVSA